MSEESPGCFSSLLLLVIGLTFFYAMITTIVTTTPRFIQKDKQNYACWAEEFRILSPEKTRWSCVKVEFNLYGKKVE